MKVFNIKHKDSFIGIKKYNIAKNKICILRKTGGYGDLLVARMMFQDIKQIDSELEITFAVPNIYKQVVQNHPFIDNVVDCTKINDEDFLALYNITNICSAYEALHGKNTNKNRSDIWADHIGIKLKNHNMFLPKYTEYEDKIKSYFKKQGYQEGQKIIAFAPNSAVPIRNLNDNIIKYILEKLYREDIFVFIINSLPLLNYSNIPFCRGSNFNEAMALVDICDAVISTDTGTLHCACGYKKPTIGIFNYVNGQVVGKYYDNLIIIQKNQDNDKDWTCGPCNDYSKCPYEIQNQVLYCNKKITSEMLDIGLSKLFQKLNLKY